MDDSVIMRNCLICNVQINECHLGIDSCRACSVFYKRTVKVNPNSLECKSGTNNCIEIKPTTSCRKCRFQKFSDVLAQSAVPSDGQDAETEFGSAVQKDSQPSTSFLDHDSFSLLPSPPSKTPLLDRIKNGYSYVCVLRKMGEITLTPTNYNPTVEEIESVNKMDFYPMTYSLLSPLIQIHSTALFDFGNATFADFRKLSNCDKLTVAVTSYKFIAFLDCAYRSIHYFPDSDTRQSKIIFQLLYFAKSVHFFDTKCCAGYSFTVSDTGNDAFLDGCPHDINREEVTDAFCKNAIKLKMVKAHLQRLAPTNAEFAFLYGFCFWSEEVSSISEPLTHMVERNRKDILGELHLEYKQRGRADYAARLGELYCVLTNLEEICSLAETDVEQYKLMNIFIEFPQ